MKTHRIPTATVDGASRQEVSMSRHHPTFASEGRSRRSPGPVSWLFVFFATFTAAAFAETIDLTHLSEKEALRAIEAAPADTVFLVRGKKHGARRVQEAVAEQRRRAAAEQERFARKLGPAETRLLDQLRLQYALDEKARAAAQKAAFDLQAAELERTLRQEAPEVLRLREEAARLAAAWIVASDEERRDIEVRAQEVAAKLRRLGAAL
jgi:hypothetical protein